MLQPSLAFRSSAVLAATLTYLLLPQQILPALRMKSTRNPRLTSHPIPTVLLPAAAADDVFNFVVAAFPVVASSRSCDRAAVELPR